MANGEWRIGMNDARFNDQVLSGPARLAGFHDIGRRMLSTDSLSSEGGDVRAHIANSAIGRFNTGKYRGRSWTRKYAVVHSVPAHRSRLAEGIGDALAARRTCRASRKGGYRASHSTMRVVGQNGSFAHPFTAAECEKPLMLTLPAIRHSPFAIRVQT